MKLVRWYTTLYRSTRAHESTAPYGDTEFLGRCIGRDIPFDRSEMFVIFHAVSAWYAEYSSQLNELDLYTRTRPAVFESR